ncbi:Hypothetical predicted protein [Pelobates cultripes]|uniref:Uncharacterized protein n=1 Tax=Pelobates cultripes TaxID=61616 RepID=A0AAD1S3D2_PELCU|nr:Hypothetical predicted protein [Pelobates cultripes]
MAANREELNDPAQESYQDCCAAAHHGDPSTNCGARNNPNLVTRNNLWAHTETQRTTVPLKAAGQCDTTIRHRLIQVPGPHKDELLPFCDTTLIHP